MSTTKKKGQRKNQANYVVTKNNQTNKENIQQKNVKDLISSFEEEELKQKLSKEKNNTKTINYQKRNNTNLKSQTKKNIEHYEIAKDINDKQAEQPSIAHSLNKQTYLDDTQNIDIPTLKPIIKDKEKEKKTEEEIELPTLKSTKKKKLRKRNIAFGIMTIFIIVMIVSSYKILMWSNDSKDINEQIKEIEEITNVEEVKDNKETITIKPAKVKKEDPYYDYIKMNLINVDFEDLINKNKDTKGWIQVSGTNINYPFVQTDDNKFYLTHSFNKSANEAGWVFMDYRNDVQKEDKNTILYAHSRLNKTMFGSLKNVLTSKWLENKNNHVIKISTEKENTLWQVFSVYYIETTSDYLKVNFKTNKEFIDFKDMLLNRSAYDFKTTVSEKDRILTLSTCHNTNEKTVLHAKLIKTEKK